MNNFFISIIVIVIVAAVYLSFHLRRDDAPPPVAIEQELPPQAPVAAESTPPPIQFPVPEPVIATEDEPAEPLPALDESDESVEQYFSLLDENRQYTDLLLFETFIRNFVVIVDNLTRDKLPQQYLFFRPPTGEFMVFPGEDELSYLNPENYTRYLPFIRLVEAIDTDRLINIYFYLYPLFQQAYEDLGYPDRYFNDRLIEVINHILEAPDIGGTIELEQPSVYYKFTDTGLESRSAGQKLLIRVGADNAAIIRARLGEVLTRLTARN